MPQGEPDYIYYGGAALPAPPFRHHARFMSLPCAGDSEAIQNFVDRSLNAATSPGRFRILSKYVFLALMSADVVSSTTPPYSREGTMSENDIGFWIPVTDTETPFSIYWYPAYLYVDNWLAVVGGREIWGFPKAWGKIDVAPGDPRGGVISVSTLAMKTLAPTEPAAMAEIFRLTPGAATGPGAEPAGDEALVVALCRLFAGEAFFELIKVMTRLLEADRAIPMAAPMIMLKQFRDASSVTAAGYRAVITADATVTQMIDGPSLKGPHCLTLNDYASQPIAADLGLPLGDQTLPFALWVAMDFVMDLGTPVAMD